MMVTKTTELDGNLFDCYKRGFEILGPYKCSVISHRLMVIQYVQDTDCIT